MIVKVASSQLLVTAVAKRLCVGGLAAAKIGLAAFLCLKFDRLHRRFFMGTVAKGLIFT